MNVQGWHVVSWVPTRRGVLPLEQLTEEEREALTISLHLAVARALAPEGVQVHLARRTAGGPGRRQRAAP